jgi:hypothetical protein
MSNLDRKIVFEAESQLTVRFARTTNQLSSRLEQQDGGIANRRR